MTIIIVYIVLKIMFYSIVFLLSSLLFLILVKYRYAVIIITIIRNYQHSTYIDVDLFRSFFFICTSWPEKFHISTLL